MSNDKRKISSLRDLPRDIAPPRDLWQGIEARIAAEPRSAKAESRVDAGGSAGATEGGRGGWRWLLGRGAQRAAAGETTASGGIADGATAAGAQRTRRVGGAGMRVLATAAVIAALAIGIWIGRAVLPVSGVSHSAGGGLSVSTLPGARESEALPVSFVMDPKFMRQRAQLLQSLGAQIAALPPDSRAKVLSSLQTIHDSMRDLEAALGKDPSNALLQELLVNTYQDEIRVLTAVNEAGDAAKGI